MKKFQITYRLLIITFVFSIMLSTVVYAEGDGDSKGNNPKPLNFISCTLESGGSINSKDGVELNVKFKLQFDKNVVNMLVWENNRSCISLVRDDNKKVDAVVSKIDDTVDFDNRQNIFLRPVGALESGRNYYIKISPKLLAKNGKSTLGETTGGKELSISFKTKGEAKSEEKKPEANNQVASSNKTEKGSEAVNKNNSKTSEGTVNKGDAGKTTEKNKDEVKEDLKQNKEEKPEEVKKEEKKEIPSEDETTEVIVKGDEADKTDNPSDKTNTDRKLTTGNYILIGAGVILVCWVIIEVFVRRRRK